MIGQDQFTLLDVTQPEQLAAAAHLLAKAADSSKLPYELEYWLGSGHQLRQQRAIKVMPSGRSVSKFGAVLKLIRWEGLVYVIQHVTDEALIDPFAHLQSLIMDRRINPDQTLWEGVQGIHLEVRWDNSPEIDFAEHIGFVRICSNKYYLRRDSTGQIVLPYVYRFHYPCWYLF